MSVSLPIPGAAGPLDWRKHFLERRFHDFLAAEHDPFQVAGVPLSPAEALQKCNPEKYDNALTDYARSEGEAALEKACEVFPAPIAIPLFRALNSAENEHERLLHFRDTAESLTVVLLAVIVGECRTRGIKLDAITFPSARGGREDLVTKKTGSKGKKLLTDRVADRLAILDGLLDELSGGSTIVCVSRIPLDAVRRLSELNDIRNDFSHYEAMTEHEAAKVCQEVREQIADAVLAFECLADTELVTFAGAVTGRPNVAKFEVHSGSTQNKNLKQRPLQGGAFTKCLGIVADHLHRPLFHCEGELFDATPFFHTELNPRGHRRHLWLFKRRVWHSGENEFQVVGERELRVIADADLTIDHRVLDELFT